MAETLGWTYEGESGGTLPTYNPSLGSALCLVQQGLSFPSFVFGGQGDAGATTYALFKKSTTYGFHIIQWKFPVGAEFSVTSIKFPVVPTISGNMEILPVLRFDDGLTVASATPINAGNYPVDAANPLGQLLIELTPKSFDNAVTGKNNFIFELQITGTDLAVVGVPLEIEIDRV